MQYVQHAFSMLNSDLELIFVLFDLELSVCLRFVCLLVCKFTDSGSRRSAALLREEPTLPEALDRPQGQADAAPFMRHIPTPPLVGRHICIQGNSLFRAPAGRRMVDLADHVP